MQGAIALGSLDALIVFWALARFNCVDTGLSTPLGLGAREGSGFHSHTRPGEALKGNSF